MRRLILVIPLVLALAACRGGDKDDSRGAGSGAPSDAAAADTSGNSAPRSPADIREALLESAEKSANVESMRATFEMDMDFGGINMGFEGDFAFRAPDQMHMTMEMFGQDLEMLVYGSSFYMDMGDGWRKVDLSSAGINLDQLSQLWENRGLVDMEEWAETFGDDVEQLDDEIIDGKTYEHFHLDADAAEIAGNVPDGLFDDELLAQIGDAIEDMQADIYVDPETGLMRRMTMEMDMDVPEAGAATMEMSFDIEEYDGDVNIPEEPVDAPPFDPSDFDPGA
jgi:hypothetical protein